MAKLLTTVAFCAIMAQGGCMGKATTKTTLQTVVTAPNGQAVSRITQTAPSGLTAKWLSYGATLESLTLSDGTNIVIGLDRPEAYFGDHPYIGSAIGRVANRIADGRLDVDDDIHSIATNEKGNTLHGGPEGFERQVWEVELDDAGTVRFRHVSPDGHQGWPGELTSTITATLTDDRLSLTYEVSADAPTAASLTHHTYFNLSGKNTIDHHSLDIAASRYTAVDDELIPTGETLDVDGARRFTSEAPIGAREVDLNYLIDAPVEDDGMRLAAVLSEGDTALRIWSSYPGLQVYSGDVIGRRGIALEPQYPPGRPALILPGRISSETIVYEFLTDVED